MIRFKNREGKIDSTLSSLRVFQDDPHLGKSARLTFGFIYCTFDQQASHFIQRAEMEA